PLTLTSPLNKHQLRIELSEARPQGSISLGSFYLCTVDTHHLIGNSKLMKQNQSEEFYKALRENLTPEHANDPKIAEFIARYLICRNAAQAAVECGLSRADGRYLYGQLDIYTVIEKLTKDAIVKHGYDASEIVERTKEIAFFDPVDLCKPDGSFIENINDVPPEARRAIKKLVAKNYFEDDVNGIPVYKGKVLTYEFWDKPKTLELLAREKDTFKKTTVVEHDVSKNARNFLLASVELANNQITHTPKEVIDVEVVKVSSIPKPPGVL
ncbi:MAG TPA: terminase small subunit, partial [Acinetobacter sp.]|nr:terminase small subunit [Acinetobacter sp.]